MKKDSCAIFSNPAQAYEPVRSYLFVDIELSEDLGGVKQMGVVDDPGSTLAPTSIHICVSLTS